MLEGVSFAGMAQLLSTHGLLTGSSAAVCAIHLLPNSRRSRRAVASTRCQSGSNGPPPAWPGRAVIKESSGKVKLPKVFAAKCPSVLFSAPFNDVMSLVSRCVRATEVFLAGINGQHRHTDHGYSSGTPRSV